MKKSNVGILFKVKKEVVPVEVLKAILPKNVKFSYHAFQRMQQRKIYFNKQQFKDFLTIENLLEIQVEETSKIKFLVRASVSEKQDVTFVINDKGNIVSCWYNKKDDHKNKKPSNLYKTYKELEAYL